MRENTMEFFSLIKFWLATQTMTGLLFRIKFRVTNLLFCLTLSKITYFNIGPPAITPILIFFVLSLNPLRFDNF